MSFGRSGPDEGKWKRRNEEVYYQITGANVKTAVKYAVLGFCCSGEEGLRATDAQHGSSRLFEGMGRATRGRNNSGGVYGDSYTTASGIDGATHESRVLNSPRVQGVRARIRAIRREKSVGRGRREAPEMDPAEDQVDEGLLTEE
jgi:hypothetical protein